MITLCIVFNMAGTVNEKIQMVIMCLVLDSTYIVPLAL